MHISTPQACPLQWCPHPWATAEGSGVATAQGCPLYCQRRGGGRGALYLAHTQGISIAITWVSHRRVPTWAIQKKNPSVIHNMFQNKPALHFGRGRAKAARPRSAPLAGPRHPFGGIVGTPTPLFWRVAPGLGHNPQAWEGSAQPRAPPTSDWHTLGRGSGPTWVSHHSLLPYGSPPSPNDPHPLGPFPSTL